MFTHDLNEVRGHELDGPLGASCLTTSFPAIAPHERRAFRGDAAV